VKVLHAPRSVRRGSLHAAAEAAAQPITPHIVPVYRHGATLRIPVVRHQVCRSRSLASMLQTDGPLESSALPANLRAGRERSGLRAPPRRDPRRPDPRLHHRGRQRVGARDRRLRDAEVGRPGARRCPRQGAADQHRSARPGGDRLSLPHRMPLGDHPLPADDGLPGLPCTFRRPCAARSRAATPTGSPACSTSSRPLGGTRPDTRMTWFGAKPTQEGRGAPVVIVDADADPAAKPLGGRIAAASAGLLVLLGGGAAWLGISRSRSRRAAGHENDCQRPGVPARGCTGTAEGRAGTRWRLHPRHGHPCARLVPQSRQRAPVVQRGTPPPAAAPRVVTSGSSNPVSCRLNAIRGAACISMVSPSGTHHKSIARLGPVVTGYGWNAMATGRTSA